VNALTTDTFLAFEYSRSSFPPDLFGLTRRQRFVLASTNIHYVRAHLPNDELAKQTQDGAPVYNGREVVHMAEVQRVFQGVFRAWQVGVILQSILGLLLLLAGGPKTLAPAVKGGGMLTSGMILSIALLAVFAWQFWFENFHLLFFTPGSWTFSYTDTLIRLFPVEFWFDATLTISILSFVGGMVLVLFGRRWEKNDNSVIGLSGDHEAEKVLKGGQS
jgi:integral membrane protein (TIGR01906 family)